MVNLRRSGVLLHPTSLPGAQGIGDLGKGAYQFVDFLALAGQKLWQILPLGPTGLSMGNSPYMPSSAFAGNPLLISLEKLSEEGLLPATELSANHGSEAVDFKQVTLSKMPLLRASFEAFLQQPQLHDAWQLFCAEQAFWLDDYALFRALKTAYGEASWTDWPTLNRAEAQRELALQIQFHQYLQYQFDRQWLALKSYANQNQIQLIGDLPIYVAHDSAEVWGHPQLFELDKLGQPKAVAGVPPDYFSATGQLWGNPLYDWKALADTDYQWWVQRLKATLRWVDEVRIDHFRAFESYWRVEATAKTAEHGTWEPGPGAKFFEQMQRSLGGLPIIAEDLGVITPPVEALRDQFGLPGMKILQFAFGDDPSNPHCPFNYGHNAVVYTGTHDNDTSLGWRDDPKVPVTQKQRLQDYLGKSTLDDIHWDLIRLALQSVADTAILPLQDLLGLDNQARMNRPGTAEGNWSWRYQPQQLTPQLAQKLRGLTYLCGRIR